MLLIFAWNGQEMLGNAKKSHEKSKSGIFFMEKTCKYQKFFVTLQRERNVAFK